jgi:hypothetical protein
MKTTEHTPAPWRIWKDQDPNEPHLIVGPSDDFICQIAMENTQAAANARLMALAPELLQYLQDTLAYLEYHHGGDPRTKNFVAMHRAAISKLAP